jgi:hypothetical protein
MIRIVEVEPKGPAHKRFLLESMTGRAIDFPSNQRIQEIADRICSGAHVSVESREARCLKVVLPLSMDHLRRGRFVDRIIQDVGRMSLV